LSLRRRRNIRPARHFSPNIAVEVVHGS